MAPAPEAVPLGEIAGQCLDAAAWRKSRVARIARMTGIQPELWIDRRLERAAVDDDPLIVDVGSIRAGQEPDD